MIWNGVMLGLTLSFMIGPLFFAVMQASLENGFKAGLSVAIGMWISDFFYTATVLYGMDHLEALASMQGFRFYAGILGGAIIASFGIKSLFFTPPPTDETPGQQKPATSNKVYSAGLLSGFLINTFNPGTIFFWLGITTAVIIPNKWNTEAMVTFFVGMFFSIILADVLKAYSAKKVKMWLTPKHVLMVQKSIGLLLLIFGTVIVFQAFQYN